MNTGTPQPTTAGQRCARAALSLARPGDTADDLATLVECRGYARPLVEATLGELFRSGAVAFKSPPRWLADLDRQPDGDPLPAPDLRRTYRRGAMRCPPDTALAAHLAHIVENIGPILARDVCHVLGQSASGAIGRALHLACKAHKIRRVKAGPCYVYGRPSDLHPGGYLAPATPRPRARRASLPGRPPARERLLAALAEPAALEGHTRRELATAADCSPRHTAALLQDLVGDGLVEQLGPYGAVVYRPRAVMAPSADAARAVEQRDEQIVIWLREREATLRDRGEASKAAAVGALAVELALQRPAEPPPRNVEQLVGRIDLEQRDRRVADWLAQRADDLRTAGRPSRAAAVSALAVELALGVADLDAAATAKDPSVYVATGLDRRAEAAALLRRLEARGWRSAYDWTTHGRLAPGDDRALRAVAVDELAGASTADVVVVMLPGGRGTHAELGAALATGRRVLLHVAHRRDLEAVGWVCSFYLHPCVRIVVGTADDLVEAVGAPAAWQS